MKDFLETLPIRSRIILGIGAICIVAILVGLGFSFNYGRLKADERAALPGKCFELPGMKEAKAVALHTLYRGEWVETIQTDDKGSKSVAFVPLLVVESRLTPCSPHTAG